MSGIGEAKREKLISSLMNWKLGRLQDWQRPSVAKTVGPYDPSCIFEFDQKRERLCDIVGSFLNSLSDQDIALLTDSSIDDPEKKRQAWIAFMRTELNELRESEPSWFDAGFGNLEYEADFEHWGRMPHFHLHEAVNLSIGFEPNQFSRDLLRDLSKDATRGKLQGETLGFLIKRFDLFGRKFPLARFHDKVIAKAELLDWFEEISLEVHPNFLIALESHSKKPAVDTEKTEKPASFTSQEKRTLLKLVAAMACEQYNFDPNVPRSDAASRIRDDLELIGADMDSKTIRKWLLEAMEFVDKDYWGKPN